MYYISLRYKASKYTKLRELVSKYAGAKDVDIIRDQKESHAGTTFVDEGFSGYCLLQVLGQKTILNQIQEDIQQITGTRPPVKPYDKTVLVEHYNSD